MASKHTLSTLAQDLESFKRQVQRRFHSVDEDLGEIRPQVQEMHDYVIDQKGFERGKSEYNKDGSIRINKDAWMLILKLVGIIATAVGIIAATKVVTK